MSRQSGNVSPQQLAEWAGDLGARVEKNGTCYKIFPPDARQRPVFIKLKLGKGRDLTNTILQLKRAGLDVMSKENDVKQPLVSPAQVAELRGRATEARPSSPAVRSAPEPRDDATEELLAMLAEAEQRITSLVERIDSQSRNLQAEIEMRREDIGLLTARVDRLEKGEPPPDPNAEIDGEILRFMSENRIQLSGSIIASNIGEKPQAVGKRLQSLLARQLVNSNEGHVTGNRLYWHRDADATA